MEICSLLISVCMWFLSEVCMYVLKAAIPRGNKPFKLYTIHRTKTKLTWLYYIFIGDQSEFMYAFIWMPHLGTSGPLVM